MHNCFVWPRATPVAGKIGLTQHAIGRGLIGIEGIGRVEPDHASYCLVRNPKSSAVVNDYSSGVVKGILRSAAYIGIKIGLAENQFGGRLIRGDRVGKTKYPVIIPIHHIQFAVGQRRQPRLWGY